MTRILLHIGSSKTGTSSLQHVMHINRQPLARVGVIYPRAGRALSNRSAHHNLCYEMQEGRRKAGIFDPARGTWRDVFEEIDASGAETAVISSEAFAACKPRQIENLAGVLRDRDVTVILYLRRQDLWLQSTWNQRARFGRASLDFWRFFEDVGYDRGRYDELISRWVANFGAANIHLRVFDAIPPGSDVVEDLRQTFFPGLDIQAAAQERKNLKAGLKQIVAVAEVLKASRQALGGDFALPQQSAMRISQFFRSRPGEIYRYSVLSYEESLELLRRFAEVNERLFTTVTPANGGGAGFPPPQPEDFDGYVDLTVAGLDIFDREERQFVQRMAREVVKAHRESTDVAQK